MRLKKNTPMSVILEDKRTIKFSRVPIYEGHIDNIVGIVLTKKIFKQALNDSNKTIEDLMKPVFHYMKIYMLQKL